MPDLNESAEDNGCDDCPRDEALGLSVHMALEVLEPQHHTESEVHRKVQHLVDVGHLIERSLGRIEEREEQYDTDDKYGQRIFLQASRI